MSARDRYSSPSPASSRRQLFTGKRPQKTATNSPIKQPLLAPKPSHQRFVQVTQLKPSQLKPTYFQEAAAAISTLLQQHHGISPQKATPILPAGGGADVSNVTIQALVSMANMKSPLTSPDRISTVPTSSFPSITLTVSPSQKMTPPQKQAATPNATPTLEPAVAPKPHRTGSIALFYRKVCGHVTVM